MTACGIIFAVAKLLFVSSPREVLRKSIAMTSDKFSNRVVESRKYVD